MNPKLQTQKILLAIKTLIKKKGLKYRDLADALEVSLPTVKRFMSQGELSLDRLVRICHWLGLSIPELFELAGASSVEFFSFTEKQERFLAAHPSYLAYFYALKNGDRSVSQIERDYRLTAKSTRKYLRKLEEFGLIELHRGDRVRILAQGVMSWSDHGILGNTFSKHMIESFSEHVVKKLSDPGELIAILNGWWLTDENYRDLKQDHQALADKYRRISSSNQKILKRSELKSVSSFVLADEWEDRIFTEIVNL